MLNFVSLRKTASGWEFDSEEALEDFVWANLPALFGLTPIKRQHIVKGQFCDILALGENNGLVVLELKNAEDRYVVQQLTRYYDALREQKPFSEQIDYDIPIRLVAVAPSFHRDNFTDIKYHKLNFVLLSFEVIQDGKQLYLVMKNSVEVSRLVLPYPEEYLVESADNNPIPKGISRPPRVLLKYLEKHSNDEQEIILQIREKILSFDDRIQEKTTARAITYGMDKGEGKLYKSKLCAEFYSYLGECSLALYLWLPYPKKKRVGAFYEGGAKKGIARWRILTDDWKRVSKLWLHLNKTREGRTSGTCEIEEYMENYTELTNKEVKSISLEALVDIALEEWQRL